MLESHYSFAARQILKAGSQYTASRSMSCSKAVLVLATYICMGEQAVWLLTALQVCTDHAVVPTALQTLLGYFGHVIHDAWHAMLCGIAWRAAAEAGMLFIKLLYRGHHSAA